MPSITKRRPSLADFEIATVAVPPVDDRIVHQVPVDEIHPSPRNPRHRLEGIDELAGSIAEHQLLQPVVVRRRGRSGYELIAGHRRLEAVKALGWTEIPAVVRDETSAKACKFSTIAYPFSPGTLGGTRARFHGVRPLTASTPLT